MSSLGKHPFMYKTHEKSQICKLPQFMYNTHFVSGEEQSGKNLHKCTRALFLVNFWTGFTRRKTVRYK